MTNTTRKILYEVEVIGSDNLVIFGITQIHGVANVRDVTQELSSTRSSVLKEVIMEIWKQIKNLDSIKNQGLQDQRFFQGYNQSLLELLEKLSELEGK